MPTIKSKPVATQKRKGLVTKENILIANRKEDDCFLMVVVGGQGSGKTYSTLLQLRHYVKHRNVLIFDSVADKHLQHFKSIDYDVRLKDGQDRAREIIKFSHIRVPQIRTVLCLRKDGKSMQSDEKKKTATDLLQYAENSLLLLDDYNNYITSNQAGDIVGPLTTLRHRKMDLIVQLQHLNALDSRLWDNLKYLRMHKMRTAIDANPSATSRLPDFILLKVAELIIDAEYDAGNKYFYLTIDLTNRKIVGATDSQLRTALIQYARLFPRELKTFKTVQAYSSLEKATNAWLTKHINQFKFNG